MTDRRVLLVALLLLGYIWMVGAAILEVAPQ